jgi:hypothetical protein
MIMSLKKISFDLPERILVAQVIFVFTVILLIVL